MENSFGLSAQEAKYMETEALPKKYYIGIDPGLRGAIAVLDEEGKLQALHDMPLMARGKGAGSVKEQVNAAALDVILSPYAGSHAVLEAVGARPGQGVSSMFSLGDSCGVIRAVLACNKIAVDMFTPQAWKKYYGLPKEKEVARAKAINLYPDASLHRKKDDGRAEAILMARLLFEHQKYH